MLGCQDFCGYYDWTFHYLRRQFGQEACTTMWAEAIGGESQQHYLQAALADGLRGLLRTWHKTGEDEHCDWAFTLDEQRNALRWDMRQCPSKGFLIDNNLNADEDYCDHCMGWMLPLLERAGVEVAVHEHNHCGQCWGEMRVRGKPYETLSGSGRVSEITADPRWSAGYVERWERNVRLPVLPAVSDSTDPSDALRDWFASRSPLAVAVPGGVPDAEVRGLITTSGNYTAGIDQAVPVVGVLVDRDADAGHLEALARRLNQTPVERRPLLMYTFLPAHLQIPFVRHGLPRPMPVLPLLIRTGVFRHDPACPPPPDRLFAELLLEALRT